MPATATRVVFQKKAIKRKSERQYLVKCIFMIRFQFNQKSTNFDFMQKLCLGPHFCIEIYRICSNRLEFTDFDLSEQKTQKFKETR